MRENVARLIPAILLIVLLPACGFHLVSDNYRLPPEWARLSVETGSGISAYSDLVILLKQQLRETQGTTVVESGSGVPKIVLSGEQFRNPVSALDAFGRAQEYLLEYIVYYQFIDASGKEVTPKKRIYLSREQSYSSAQILPDSDKKNGVGNEIREDHEGQPADQRHHRLLPSAVHEKAEPNRTEKQAPEKQCSAQCRITPRTIW